MPATCLSFLLVADALKTPSTVSVIASLACACLSLSFILFHRFPFFHCRSIDFDSLLINFLPDIDSSLFLKIIFFSLPFSPSKKNKQTNSAIFLIFKKQNTTFCFFFSLCVCALRVWNFYFAALNYYSSSSSFLCGLFLFFFSVFISGVGFVLLPFWLCVLDFLGETSDYEEEDDDDLEFIDASYPKRASLPFVSPLPLRSKAVQRQLSVD